MIRKRRGRRRRRTRTRTRRRGRRRRERRRRRRRRRRGLSRRHGRALRRRLCRWPLGHQILKIPQPLGYLHLPHAHCRISILIPIFAHPYRPDHSQTACDRLTIVGRHPRHEFGVCGYMAGTPSRPSDSAPVAGLCLCSAYEHGPPLSCQTRPIDHRFPFFPIPVGWRGAGRWEEGRMLPIIFPGPYTTSGVVVGLPQWHLLCTDKKTGSSVSGAIQSFSLGVHTLAAGYDPTQKGSRSCPEPSEFPKTGRNTCPKKSFFLHKPFFLPIQKKVLT